MKYDQTKKNYQGGRLWINFEFRRFLGVFSTRVFTGVDLTEALDLFDYSLNSTTIFPLPQGVKVQKDSTCNEAFN